MNYSYRADGVKIKKAHHYFSVKKSTDAIATTEYIDGFQYSEDTANIGLAEQNLKFFSTSEGYFDFANNRYIYHYSDHLGNVRLSFVREGGAAVIVEKNDYYAFGLKHGNPTFDLSGVNYNYEYNGKELQQETGMYDYGARFYMPDLGRWGVVDPLSEMYRRHSPYNYAVNNPMRFIDPDGRNVVDVNGHGSHMTYDGDDAAGMLSFLQGMSSGNSNSSNNGIPSFNFSYIDPGGAAGGGGGGGSLTVGELLGGGSLLSGWMQNNIGSKVGPGPDLLSLMLLIAGVNPNAPANMYSLGVIASLFAPKDAWIAVGNTDTMNEWSQGYIKFNTSSNGLFIDPVDPQGSKIKGITNPVTGKIILAPGLFDGKRSNYGLGDVVIHEVDHFNNWKNGKLQGNHPLIQDLNEVSAYKAASQWTGSMFGAEPYLKSINNYIFNLLHIITK